MIKSIFQAVTELFLLLLSFFSLSPEDICNSQFDSSRFDLITTDAGDETTI